VIGGVLRRPIALMIALCAAAGACCLPGRALAVSPPQLSVRSAVLIDQNTGQELFRDQADRELPIASTTKLMTALLTLEHVQLDQVFTQNDYEPAAVDSQIGLVPGERMSVHDLLLALLLPSADDAAEDLAYNIGHGSVARFIGMMNARARALGLNHTHYSTPAGLDTPGNYSSASDLVKLASYLLAHHPFFDRVVALPSAVLRTGNHVRFVLSTNDLVGKVPWINGVKTGHTLDAGYVLVGSGHKDGMTLISAVLGTSSESARDANTLALLSYGFATFHLVTAVRAGSIWATPSVRYRAGVRADVIAANTFRQVVSRSTRLTTRVEVPHQLAGPLRSHAIVGVLLVLADGRTMARIPLLLASPLPAVSPLTIAAGFITQPLMLLLLAAVLGAGITLIVRRRTRMRTRTRSRGVRREAA
jgi:serine-type D-Ala-D-Ala carboxypeptidase (penicillin-binding protein 5/6)